MQFIILVNQFLWNYILIIALLFTGIFFTFKLRLVQIRFIPEIYKRVFSSIKSKDKADLNGMSQFQSLATAIAGQVGTGNLAGTATAIVSGGPGAIFWMWLSAFFGMSTIFAEAILGQKFKTRINGEIVAGPAFYIRNGLKNKTLASIFAVSTIFALGFMSCMIQSNTISLAAYQAFNIDPIVTGCIVTLVAFCIFAGNTRAIAGFSEKIVPIMATFYLVICFILLFLRADYILPAFYSIFESAFRLESIGGGAAGITIAETMRYGFARGLFSNEAGMGSTPHVHGIAKVDNACKQAELAVFGVFFDTFIVITLTAMIILSSSFYIDMIQSSNTGYVTSIALTQECFTSIIGDSGNIIIAITLFIFAFSTMISGYFYAFINVKYLFETRFLKLFIFLVLIFIFSGSLTKVDLAWELVDTFSGIMCIPNLIALLFLNKVIKDSLEEYVSKK